MSIESINSNIAAAAPAPVPVVASQQPRQANRSDSQAREAQSLPAGSQAQSIRPENREQARNTVSDTPLEDAVAKLTDFVSSIRSEISFSVDEASGTRVVKVLDSQSREVIRQIPSEEAIQLAQALDKLQGLFVRDKA